MARQRSRTLIISQVQYCYSPGMATCGGIRTNTTTYPNLLTVSAVVPQDYIRKTFMFKALSRTDFSAAVRFIVRIGRVSINRTDRARFKPCHSRSLLKIEGYSGSGSGAFLLVPSSCTNENEHTVSMILNKSRRAIRGQDRNTHDSLDI